MSKKRVSMRGRGKSLLGRGVDALFSDTPPPDEVSPENADAKLEEMLAAEAHDATMGKPIEPSPVAHPDQTTTPAEPEELPEKGGEVASAPTGLPQGDAGTEDIVAVAGDGVSLSEEELMDAIDVPLGEGPQAAPPEPPTPSEPSPITRPKPETPPESAPQPTPTPAYTPSPPPVRIGGQLTEVIMAPGELDDDTVRPPSPFERPTPPIEVPELPPESLPEEDRARILAQLDQERLDELHKRIDQLYREVPRKISNRPDLTAQILGMLRQARTILVEHPYDFIEAEYKIQQAYAIYNRIENSEKWGDKYGWRVFWYEVITFFLLLFSFLGLLAFGNDFSAFLARLFGADQASEGILTAVGFWSTFVWGGIGGVVGALYTLWTHVSERQDFERQHVMWYIAQPIMGLILGGVTFLVINTGLLSLQGGQTAAMALRESVQLFPSLIAFIAGFRPQFIFGLLVKIIKLINPTSE